MWSATVGNDFDVGDAAEEVDTIGGYLVTRAGRLPVRGEIVPDPGCSSSKCSMPIRAASSAIRITRLKERRDRQREPRRPGRRRALADAPAPPSGA